MPNAAGWPYAAEVFAKVKASAPGPMNINMADGMDSVLQSVIAEFQSAPGFDGSGGTGRRFDTVTETRTFDGSGYSEQSVDDIVPGTDFTVTSYSGLPFTVQLLRPLVPTEGYNRLALVSGNGYGGWGGQYGFPVGVQNIAVTATWGFAATVPADVCEAVLCEAASRSMVQYFVPLTGVGEEIHLEEFEIITSSGISVWDKSSPIAIFHSVYLNAVKRYRVGNAPKLKMLATSRRMS